MARKNWWSRLTPFQWIGVVLSVTVAPLPLFFHPPGLGPEGSRMLAIFLFAVFMWVTEAIPLVATAVGIILLEVMLVAKGALLPVAAEAPKSSVYFASLASPVIMLFLGGFMVADAAAKYKLDRNLAAVMLKPFAHSARLTVLGLMIITAALSAIMSNTATTATMFAIVIPVLAGLPDARTRAGMALSIPLAANVGGIATPIGSPPNAIALGALNAQGIKLSFINWMLATLPLVVLLMAFGWLLLCVMFVKPRTPVNLELQASFDKSPRALAFYVIAIVTIGLWFTGELHGLSANTVGFMAVVALLATSVMTGEDLKNLQWPVLWLVGGGIALGTGVGTTGLDEWLIGLVDWNSLPTVLLLVVLGLVAVGMSTMISNSATANLLIPLAMALTGTVAVDPTVVGVIVAIACGLALALPISTPPNAIAYATGAVKTADMARSGIIIGIIGLALTTLLMPLFWQATGLL